MTFEPGETVNVTKKLHINRNGEAATYTVEGKFIEYLPTKGRALVEIQTKALGLRQMSVPVETITKKQETE